MEPAYSKGMKFDSQTYGGAVASILQLEGDGYRPMPLSGLYLYFGCWKEAHETAQDVATPEGSYWHAIVHRQEPDAGNSGYWFRQVGAHAIFPALRDAAVEIGLDVGPLWKPEAFIELCERARQSPGSEIERQAREVQRAEWQLLFDYCARL